MDADPKRMLAEEGFFRATEADTETLRELVARKADPGRLPHAARIERNIPVYDVPALAGVLADPERERALLAEWAGVLRSGPGVFALSGACGDMAAIDAATEIYTRIIADEKAAKKSGADHFAAAGKNDRVWNSLQKLCLADPEVFARYFGVPAIDAASRAWLGPGYQMTAQVNLVHPGGKAQEAHRDYHLGFQTAEEAARFPKHMHELSPLLTLQGAIAHCDMPVESGPTKLLPFSQLLPDGYVCFRHPEIRAIFEENFVQIPLRKGDALFFNPALLHAAGDNVSAGIQRMANLLQVSSPMGIALEAVNRTAMTRALYPALVKLLSEGALSELELRAAVSAAADGYPFPTNLDTDPPVGGLAPETQRALVLRALSEGVSVADFDAALDAQAARRRA